MLASEDPTVADGLLLFSYPLHPPSRPEQRRTAHLPNLRTPSFFVHGTRDPFGSIAEIDSLMDIIPARIAVMPVERAGHDLRPLIKDAARVVKEFLRFFE
jgi:predicted alpha/beta-hydrolase family hydrolase